MSEFNIESESIDVEQIMDQIRTRIRDKRGEDYTEEQISELASVKLEQFLDPTNVRSGMVQYYQKRLKEKEAALRDAPQAPPSFEFDPDIIYRSSRGLPGQILYRIRKLLSPFLKFFFNPAPIVHALTVQQQINERQARVINQMVRTQAEFIEIAALNFEVMNNLVVEMTRLSIEMKNHRMRVESVAGRLDFDERRARALEKVVQYREGGAAPAKADADGTPERRRRRRRRGRRRPSGAASPVDGETSVQPPLGSASEVSGDSPNSEGAASASETGQPADTTASTPVESGSSAAPTGAPGAPGRPQDQESSSTPAVTSPGVSAPPADDAGRGSDHPAASSGETDPSDR